MPYINVSTSAKVNDKEKLLEEISIRISSLTNKSRTFVMAKIDDNCQMYFDDETPSCFLEKLFYFLNFFLMKDMPYRMNLFRFYRD